MGFSLKDPESLLFCFYNNLIVDLFKSLFRDQRSVTKEVDYWFSKEKESKSNGIHIAWCLTHNTNGCFRVKFLKCISWQQFQFEIHFKSCLSVWQLYKRLKSFRFKPLIHGPYLYSSPPAPGVLVCIAPLRKRVPSPSADQQGVTTGTCLWGVMVFT